MLQQMNDNNVTGRAAESAEATIQQLIEQRNINQRATKRKQAEMPGTKRLDIPPGEYIVEYFHGKKPLHLVA